MSKRVVFCALSAIVAAVACSSATEGPSPSPAPIATSAPSTPAPTATPTGTTAPTGSTTPEPPPPACNPPAKPDELYALSANTLILSRNQSMCEYRGKVMLIVNVASYCGNTPQYEGLQNLYKKYGPQGLVVLGFPSNEFGEQEPGTAQDIKDFCEKTYGVEFPMYEKIETNGPNAHPIYKWLKSQGPEFAGDIDWNFAKFLVGRDGKAVKRYLNGDLPESPEIVADIEAALARR